MNLLDLSDEEILFLKTLDSFEGGHVADESLRKKLKAMGIEEELFNSIKRNLIFKGYIGSVYGNITLEKRPNLVNSQD